jgi:hypothetical protein
MVTNFSELNFLGARLVNGTLYLLIKRKPIYWSILSILARFAPKSYKLRK